MLIVTALLVLSREQHREVLNWAPYYRIIIASKLNIALHQRRTTEVSRSTWNEEAFCRVCNNESLHYKGWAKSCDPNVRAYCGLIINAMNLIFAEIPYFRQPFEDFIKITQKFIHLLFIFVHFSLFRQLLTNCYW